MKQCPNRDCIIYTRLDELPDAYERCPQCDTPLVEAELATGRLVSRSLEEALAEASTSPYAAPAAVGAYDLPQQAQQPQQPRYAQGAFEDYDAYADPYQPEGAVDPLASAAAGPRSVSLRAFVAGTAAFALLVACIALAIILSGRFTAQGRFASSASATQTALAWLSPPVNTAIPLFPTIAVTGLGAQQANPPLPADPANPGAQPAATPLPPAPPAPAAPGASLAAVPLQDALMCARLDGGEPVGTTSAYKASDPFNLAVKADFGPGSVTALLTRWYGPDGGLIYEMRKSYAQSGSYYAGFTLNKSAPWLQGDYRVDIYTNGAAQPSSSVGFSVIP